MSKIIVHADVGSELARTEWESDTTHSLFSDTSFPDSPSEMDLFYRTDEHIWYIYNGSEWKDLTGDAGASTFVGLSDTPSVYTSAGGYFVRVNSTPDGLEFVQYIDHDSDLSNVSVDDHHSETHVLATSGPHTGTFPLADLAVGSQGSIIRRGGSDWEEYVLGTTNYVLKAGASDVAWGQVDWDELTNKPSTFVPSAHEMVDSIHTDSGLTTGYVIRASGTTTFVWAQLGHGDLGGVTGDLHHNEAHILGVSGPHTGTLPLTDLAVGTQGGIIRRGAVDWEEYALGTENYVLKAGASDIAWGQVDWSELTGKPSTFAPSVHEMVDSIHTDTGLTVGYVIRVSGASAFAWAELQHGDLGGVTGDLHHSEAHVLGTSGPHTGTLPLADLAVGSQGSIVRRGASDWEEYTLGTQNYVLKAGATDVAWGQVTWGEVTGKPTEFTPIAHALDSAYHTGDLAYTQLDAIVDVSGTGANNLLSRADHVHTDADGSSKVTYSNLASIPSTFTPINHGLSSGYHTGDLAYSQLDSLVDVAGGGSASLISGAQHVHTGADGSSKVDHGGGLTGLGDDDHTIYLLASGARAVGGNLVPDGASTRSLGSATAEWANLYIGTGRVYLYSDQAESVRSDGSTIIWGVSATDELKLSGSALYPNASLGLDLGTSSLSWNQAFIKTWVFAKPADTSYNGDTVEGVAGETLALGDVVRLNSSTQWVKADADAEASSKGLIGVAVEAISASATGTILLKGFLRDDTNFNYTIGAELWIDLTPGKPTSTKPSVVGDIVRLVAYAWDADTIYVDPDKTYVEVTA